VKYPSYNFLVLTFRLRSNKVIQSRIQHEISYARLPEHVAIDGTNRDSALINAPLISTSDICTRCPRPPNYFLPSLSIQALWLKDCYHSVDSIRQKTRDWTKISYLPRERIGRGKVFSLAIPRSVEVSSKVYDDQPASNSRVASEGKYERKNDVGSKPTYARRIGENKSHLSNSLSYLKYTDRSLIGIPRFHYVRNSSNVLLVFLFEGKWPFGIPREITRYILSSQMSKWCSLLLWNTEWYKVFILSLARFITVKKNKANKIKFTNAPFAHSDWTTTVMIWMELSTACLQ